MNREQTIEAMLQEKGLNAPRLTPDDIDAVIVEEQYSILPSGKTVVCELTLKNGFTVRGDGSSVSIENFDPEIGAASAREKARNKIWELEGYLLQERLYQDKQRAEVMAATGASSSLILPA